MFGNVKVAKNADPGMIYSYSGYGIGFDSRSLFWIRIFSWGKNAIIFGVDMMSYLCILIIQRKVSWFLVKDQHKD